MIIEYYHRNLQSGWNFVVMQWTCPKLTLEALEQGVKYVQS